MAEQKKRTADPAAEQMLDLAAEEGIQMDQYRNQLETFKERREQLKVMMDAQNQQRDMAGMANKPSDGAVS